MKIEHIEAVLSELQEEDQTELNSIKTELVELQAQLPKCINELNAIEEESKRVEFLDNLKRNDLQNMHAYLPLFEIPISLILLSNIATSGIVGPIEIIQALLVTGALADIICVSETIYKNLDSEYNPFKRLWNVAKKLRMSKREIRAKEITLWNQETKKKEEVEDIQKKISESQDRVQDLRHELAYIDGNLQGVRTIKRKHHTDEIKDNTRVVNFVTEVEGRKLTKRP